MVFNDLNLLGLHSFITSPSPSLPLSLNHRPRLLTMTLESNLLLSIDHLTVLQLDPSSSSNDSHPTIPSPHHDHLILFPSTTLDLHLIEIPSNLLKSIPNQSQPPSYDLSIKSHSHPPELTLDTWLLLSLAGGLIEIPLSRDSSVSFHPPRSYSIQIQSDQDPRSLSSPDDRHQPSIRLELPDQISPDTLDTLDSILTAWTRFTAPRTSNLNQFNNTHQIPHKSFTPTPPSHPSSSSSSSHSDKPDRSQNNHTTSSSSNYQNGTPSKAQIPNQGRLALMDESTGEICGELGSDISLQAPVMTQHTPPYPPSSSNHSSLPTQALVPYPLLSALQPVIVSLSHPDPSSDQPTAQVSPIPTSNGKSQILSGAEWVSRGIIAGSEVISNMIIKSGNSYLANSQPAAVPMTFSSRTHANADKVLGFTRSACKVSGKTAAMIGSVVGKVGDSIGKSTGIQRSPSGQPPTGARGYVHKGLVAFNTVFDSLETGGKKLLATAGDTATSVVTHAYGPEAGQIAQRANHSVRNVSLVYIDARGVTRRAILRSVGKAAIRGRMDDGREVVLGPDRVVDDWVISPEPTGSASPSSSHPPKN